MSTLPLKLASSSLRICGTFVASRLQNCHLSTSASVRMKIYTKTGDKGTSALFTGERRAKNDMVFEALGTTDELSSQIAVAREFAIDANHGYEDRLRRVQCILQDVASSVATPTSSARDSHMKKVYFSDRHTAELEEWIDEYSKELPPLENFILPGGGKASAALHVARTVCRRAERCVTPLVRSGETDKQALIYLNRLSDFLFTAARYAAKIDLREETIYIRPDITEPKSKTEAKDYVCGNPSVVTTGPIVGGDSFFKRVGYDQRSALGGAGRLTSETLALLTHVRGITMSGDQRTVIKGNPSQYVKLNVGGSLYYTTIGTLTKMQDTMLHAMFSGRMEVLTDSEGWILIDRCGKHFGTILNYLRDGNVPLPNNQEVEEILAEAKFYCIAGLVNHCEKTIETRKMGLGTICQVPFITSEDERKLFIAGATKPVVELLINRHNNKYSYTSTSDENLLKNLEMFDRLALRFNGRIHFIKDAIGPSEICCWRFYGNGKKFAEVCCTSIVYATDRKHTKVEFPEARIYEETLNSFLYENRPGPDQELMRATSVRGGGGVVSAVNCTSDEEEDRLNRRIGHKTMLNR